MRLDFFLQLHLKEATVGIKYSVRDLIYYVIKYCIWSCDMGKISVYDKVVIKKLKKINDGNKEILHEFPSKRWFMNGNHNFVSK